MENGKSICLSFWLTEMENKEIGGEKNECRYQWWYAVRGDVQECGEEQWDLGSEVRLGPNYLDPE